MSPDCAVSVPSRMAADPCRPTTKHQRLEQSDVQAFVIAEPFFRNLDALAAKLGLERAELRVLDWGCGRGAMTLKLREAGFDAFGLDVDPEPIDNGKNFVRSLGFDPDHILRTWNPVEPPPFEQHAFHAIVSDQVIEHVGPLDQTLRAMHRVLKPGGIAVHQFPSRHRIFEPHLQMPLVHWIPPGPFRYLTIRAMCALGIGVVWSEAERESSQQRARRYTRYSENNTFYRSRRRLKAAAVQAGFSCRFWGWGSTSRLLRPMRAAPVLREIRQQYQLSMLTTWMHLTKDEAASFGPSETESRSPEHE